jgi:hypothetical protein
LFGLLAQKRLRKTAGEREIKRPPETGVGTARDYSTTFDAGLQEPWLHGPTILLSHEAAEWKKILSARAENLGPAGEMWPRASG